MPKDAKTQLYQWPDKMLFIGRLEEVAPHRHGANAWCFSLDGELGLASGRAASWNRSASARVTMGCEHRLHGGGRPVAVLYLHPEFDDWRAAATATGAAAACLLPQAAPALLHDAYGSDGLSGAALAELGAGLDRLLYREREPRSRAGSAAVVAAADMLMSRLERNLPLAQVAVAAGLSAGRLNHRFSAELGLPLRRFRGWHRLLRALELALRGGSLTAAALDAGFASPAHLSSAFKATFGLPPTAVLRAPGLEFRAAVPRPSAAMAAPTAPVR